MTPDLIHALTISGAILIGVVILTIGISFVTVRRGELAMKTGNARQHGRTGRH